MKLKIPIDGEVLYMSQLNSFLPPDIRVFSINKTTKRFHAKDFCTRRRYEYLLPTYTFTNHMELNVQLEAAKLQQGIVMDAGKPGGYADPDSIEFLAAPALAIIRKQISNYRIDENTNKKLQEALEKFSGTKKYHNFTSEKSPTDTSSQRFITEFSASAPFVHAETGVEYVKITILGQSFLLNQVCLVYYDII